MLNIPHLTYRRTSFTTIKFRVYMANCVNNLIIGLPSISSKMSFELGASETRDSEMRNSESRYSELGTPECETSHSENENPLFFSTIVQPEKEFSTHFNNLIIGGTSCVGKSNAIRRASKMRSFKCLKNSQYFKMKKNDSAIEAHNYLFSNLRLAQVAKNAIIDRSPLDNLAYQIVYKLMFKKPVNVNDFLKFEFETVSSVISFIKESLSECKSKVVFVIDSDLEKLANRMKSRNEKSDMNRANCVEYLKYQNLVFENFAKLMGADLIDIKGDCSKLNLEPYLNLIGYYNGVSVEPFEFCSTNEQYCLIPNWGALNNITNR